MKTACKVRMGIIESTYGAKAGHPGGSLSASDMFTYLYSEYRSPESQVGGPGPLCPFEGSYGAGAVRGPCQPGLLPDGGSAHPAAQ